MGITINGQAYAALFAFLLGLCIGFIYDFFRSLRRKFQSAVLTGFLDALFCLICAFSMFIFGMTVGEGQQRIFSLIFSAIGFTLYIQFFSFIGFFICSLIVKTVSLILEIIFAPLAFFFKLIKKFGLFIKKLFHNQIKRRIMKGVYSRVKKAIAPGCNNHKKGAGSNETKAGRYYY